jgi:hypothetical protein
MAGSPKIVSYPDSNTHSATAENALKLDGCAKKIIPGSLSSENLFDKVLPYIFLLSEPL